MVIYVDGILLIDKEVNYSSFQAINKAKRLIKADKVGHSGTLDPFATGLLVVTVNKATKVNQFIETQDKEYIATLKLGVKTSTLDLEGEVLATKEVPSLNEELIINALNKFKGKIKQIPPMFSALKVNGQKLYDLARQGIEIERKEREVEIFNIELISFNEDEIKFKVHCSKGTYIRTLGESISEELNTYGHLIQLRRTRVGNFKVEDAYKLDELDNYKLFPIKDALTHYPKIQLNDDEITKIKNGLKFKFNTNENEVLIIDKNEEPIAIYEKHGNIYRSKRGLF